jgi:hypothetical protein
MSDTPETDAALYPMNQVDIVWPEFARKLERERDEAREAFVIATDQMVIVQGRAREFLRELDDLFIQNTKIRDIAERAIWRMVNGVCLPDSEAIRATQKEGLRLRTELDQIKEGAK